MSSSVLNIISIVLASLSSLFYMIGCIGYSDTDGVIKNVSWFNFDYNGQKGWYGLQMAVGEYTIGSTTKTTSQTWSDCSSNSHICKTCEEDGNGTVALLIIATIFAFIVIIFSGINISASSQGLQTFNVFIAFFSWLCGVVAVGVFMNKCFNEVNSQYDNTSITLNYGSGAVLSIVGFVLMFIVVILQIGASVMGGGNGAMAKQTSAGNSV